MEVIITGTLGTFFEFWNYGAQRMVADHFCADQEFLLVSTGDIALVWIWTQLTLSILMAPFIGASAALVFLYCDWLFHKPNWIWKLYIALFLGAMLSAILFMRFFENQHRKLEPIDLEHLKYPILVFVLSVYSCAWTAWQAWRAIHPEARFWPRFSLGTLLLVVFAWGILIAVFTPTRDQ